MTTSKTVSTSLRIPQKLASAIEARRAGMSQSAWLIEAATEKIARADLAELIVAESEKTRQLTEKLIKNLVEVEE